MAPGFVPQKATLAQVPALAEGKMNVVCVGAHPGDPEFGCGGSMSKYSEAGHNVTFLYLTRGEAYDAKQSHDKSAAIRTKEAEVACKALNVKSAFAGQIDGSTIVSNEMSASLHKLIESLKPDLLFSHWPVDSHQDHQVAGLLSLTAWIKMNKPFDLYFYEVNTGSETMGFHPTDYIDITANRDKKKMAMNAHQSQDPVKTYDDFFKAMEEFRGLEAGVPAAEAFIRFTKNGERAALLQR